MGFIDKLREKDKFWIGFILGIALPLVLFPILRPLDPGNFRFISKEYNVSLLSILPFIATQCIFPNALLFFIFIGGHFDKAAKGVLYATMALVGILVVIRIIPWG